MGTVFSACPGCEAPVCPVKPTCDPSSECPSDDSKAYTEIKAMPASICTVQQSGEIIKYQFCTADENTYKAKCVKTKQLGSESMTIWQVPHEGKCIRELCMVGGDTAFVDSWDVGADNTEKMRHCDGACSADTYKTAATCKNSGNVWTGSIKELVDDIVDTKLSTTNENTSALLTQINMEGAAKIKWANKWLNANKQDLGALVTKTKQLNDQCTAKAGGEASTNLVQCEQEFSEKLSTKNRRLEAVMQQKALAQLNYDVLPNQLAKNVVASRNTPCGKMECYLCPMVYYVPDFTWHEFDKRDSIYGR